MTSPNDAAAAKLKDEGNQAFKAKQYAEADAAYSSALHLLASSQTEAMCTLHVNRWRPPLLT
jgi:hypothetical protein